MTEQHTPRIVFIERRIGPGEDVCLLELKFNWFNCFLQVELTDTNESPSASDTIFPHRKWSGKLHELERNAEEVGLGIRDIMKDILH